MPNRDSNEPNWREKAVALEYWALTAFVAGSLIYGVVAGVAALLE